MLTLVMEVLMKLGISRNEKMMFYYYINEIKFT